MHIYICMQEVLSLDAEDLAAAESLCVPSERAWVLLSSDQNPNPNLDLDPSP